MLYQLSYQGSGAALYTVQAEGLQSLRPRPQESAIPAARRRSAGPSRLDVETGCFSPPPRAKTEEVVEVLAVAVGGAVGSVARFEVGLWLAPWSRTLPVATILINVLGSFLISFFGTLTLAHGKFPAAEPWRLLVMVGFCGGFTTFSSFSLQTLDLLRGGAVGRACVNVAVSVALCLLSVAAGHYTAAALNGGAVQIAQVAKEEEA